MQPGGLFTLGVMLIPGCARRVPDALPTGVKDLPRLAADATMRFHLTVSSVALMPDGELRVDVGDDVSRKLSVSVVRDTMATVARWIWTETETRLPALDHGIAWFPALVA